VDLEFDRVLEEREFYRSEADVSGTEAKLNVDLLEKTLDSLLPEANKIGDEDYSELLSELTFFGIETQQQLRTLLEQHLDQALTKERRRVATNSKDLNEGRPVHGTTPERILKGVFYTHGGLVRTILGIHLGPEWETFAIKKAEQRSSS
jgi:putative GTP pyrophosphokinase